MRYGRMTPKVEFQKFHIEKAHCGAHCNVVVRRRHASAPKP
jgi:hypothetical protein